MSEPDRNQAMYVHLGVAQAIIENVLENIDSTIFGTDYFKHRIDLINVGLKMTESDMKKVLNTPAPPTRACY